MNNLALLCFFATCAIFMIAPSAGGPSGPEQVEVPFKRPSPVRKLPRLIHVNHRRHPNQICNRMSSPEVPVIWAVLLVRDDGSFCSKNIICVTRNPSDPRIEIDERPVDGVQCKPHYVSDTHRHICRRGKCVRVDGYFPEAPKDQDTVSKDYVEGNYTETVIDVIV